MIIPTEDETYDTGFMKVEKGLFPQTDSNLPDDYAIFPATLNDDSQDILDRRFYRVVQDPMSWQDAQDVCRRDGAELAIIRNSGDHEHVTGAFLIQGDGPGLKMAIFTSPFVIIF